MMHGLYRAFKAKNLIFMSARFNPQQVRFLKQTYDIEENKVLNFKPRFQIEGSEKEGEELDYEAEMNENEDFLIQRMCERIETEIVERPVLIF